ncbi:MFS transporter [Paucibacter sp. DJ1R-11]|uniref:MFS transporter n=1 Tax=Paucibacter sp. DJ1R-11 TaxID=2893556 RepID=UPI0021E39AB0|nr:MFS transporter [Paucibacter sp. DJ1R-11]MCV2362589.1 MFS transporter [Paucibacter sp. DJ1R-11]
MPLPSLDARHRTVAALGVAQTLAWASSYYLPALLASAMARELGLASATIFAAFSAALLASAVVGPYAGRCIDRWGGRPVLMLSNLVFALGLLALSQAQGLLSLFLAWLIMGLAMGAGLYEAAFATLVRLYGREARNAITGITLIAGFASTVGWPLTGWLEAHWGWRAACMAWAGLHLLLALPLNFSVPRAQRLVVAAPELAGASAEPVEAEVPAAAPAWRSVLILSWVFAVTWFISTAMAAHLPRLLMAGGVSLAAAVAVGALIGPAQVAARLLEFGVLRHVHPLLSARLATLMHPVAAALLALLGAPLASAFALLHGAGNGILTIAKGTLPLVLFGPQGYGQRQGWMMVPARLAQALAPWLFGLCLDRWGAQSLWLSCGLGLLAFLALLALPKPAPGRA